MHTPQTRPQNALGVNHDTALIYIAAKLTLPDLLADGPQSSDTFCESWSSSARRTPERAAGPNNRGVGPSFLSLWPSSRHGGKGRLDFLYSTSRAIRRDAQARHNSRVASIQYASGRWLWCNRVWVRSLKVLLQL